MHGLRGTGVGARLPAAGGGRSSFELHAGDIVTSAAGTLKCKLRNGSKATSEL